LGNQYRLAAVLTDMKSSNRFQNQRCFWKGRMICPLAHPFLSRYVSFRGPFPAFVFEENSIRDPTYLRLQPDSFCTLANSVLYPVSGETKLGPSMRGIVQFGRVRKLALL
jgi:hypothetical protein